MVMKTGFITRTVNDEKSDVDCNDLNINAKAERPLSIIYILWNQKGSVLLTTETRRNYHWGQLLKTIDKIEH